MQANGAKPEYFWVEAPPSDPVLGKILDKLGDLCCTVKELYASVVEVPSPPKVHKIILSSAGNTQHRQLPIDARISGLWIGGDTAGRGTLQIGTWLFPFWIPANQSQYYSLGEDDYFAFKSETITWNAPSGTTNWDVIVLAHPAAYKLTTREEDAKEPADGAGAGGGLAGERRSEG